MGRENHTDDLWETNQKNTYDQMQKSQNGWDNLALQHAQNAVTTQHTANQYALLGLAIATDRVWNVDIVAILESQVAQSGEALAARIAELILQAE